MKIPCGVMIKTIAEACELILELRGVSMVLAGSALPNLHRIPDEIIELNDCIGKVWLTDEHPLVAPHNGVDRGLFSFCNEFLNPLDFEFGECGAKSTNSHGIEFFDCGLVNFWRENQGVYTYAFKDNDGKVYAQGDWWGGGLTVEVQT